MSEPGPDKFGLRFRIFLFFALIGLGSALAIVGALFMIGRVLEPDTIAPLVLYGGAAIFVILGLTCWVWLKFDDNVARPILSIVNDVQAAVHAGATRRLTAGEGKYLGFLEPSVDQVLSALERARLGVTGEVQKATDDADRQKRWLETVLRDLEEGVVICRLDHTILLYNKRAQRLLSRPEQSAGGPGLGRSLTALMASGPLHHSLERLVRRFESGRHADHRDGLMLPLAALTDDGEDTLFGRMSLMLDDADEAPRGYVITLQRVTEELAAGIWRDRQLHEATRDMRRRLASLSMAAETLLQIPDLPEEEQGLLNDTLREEPLRLSARLDQLDEVAGDLLAGAWPTSAVYSPTLFDCVAGLAGGETGRDISQRSTASWLECDSTGLVSLLAFLIARVADEGSARRFVLNVTLKEKQAYIDIDYEGQVMKLARLDAWLQEPLDSSHDSLSGAAVLSRHKSEVWPERIDETTARLRLPVTMAKGYESRQVSAGTVLPARPEFYDFDLFGRTLPQKLEDTPLKSLEMVVFDTETTGLEPGGGDEIVSIAGVRVFNGRVLSGETFDQLVNPGRSIPAASTRIHHITEEMVRNVPPVERVLPHFHAFADGAVLVAHNAAFDMSFLNKDSERAGIVFHQPVLDTVLLAAHIFGSSESLTLDTLAERFSVTIDEKDRHTALGDSLATASVLLALFNLLAPLGVKTLGDAINVSIQQVAIRRRQKRS